MARTLNLEDIPFLFSKAYLIMCFTIQQNSTYLSENDKKQNDKQMTNTCNVTKVECIVNNNLAQINNNLAL